MPSFSVIQNAKGKPEAVFKKLKTYCSKKLVLKEVGGLKPNIQWTEENQTGKFNEKGVKGTIRVVTGSSCQIRVDIDIPLLMFPFKNLIADSIRNHLAKLA